MPLGALSGCDYHCLRGQYEPLIGRASLCVLLPNRLHPRMPAAGDVGWDHIIWRRS